MSNGSTIAVAGATGETGRLVVRRLVERGLTVRALCRDEARARAILGGEGVALHRGDVRDRASLADFCRGASTLVSCLGTRDYFGKNNGAAVDAEGTANLVASRGACDRVVFLSAFGLDRSSPFLWVFSKALNDYFRWKALAEARVRESGARYAIVRPVELRNRAAKSQALLNQRAPLSLLRTVSRELVADVLVACVMRPELRDVTFELCEGGDASIEDQLDQLVTDASRPPIAKSPLIAW